jgi:hypothetical protein
LALSDFHGVSRAEGPSQLTWTSANRKLDPADCFRFALDQGTIAKMSPNLVTIELFSDRLYSMLWDASRSTGLYSVCILKVAMPIRRGTTLIVVGITAILLLALIFVVPALINVDRYRSQVISYLQEKTGKQVEIGRLALTFFPVTIHIDHIGVKNPPVMLFR